MQTVPRTRALCGPLGAVHGLLAQWLKRQKHTVRTFLGGPWGHCCATIVGTLTLALLQQPLICTTASHNLPHIKAARPKDVTSSLFAIYHHPFSTFSGAKATCPRLSPQSCHPPPYKPQAFGLFGGQRHGQAGRPKILPASCQLKAPARLQGPQLA